MAKNLVTKVKEVLHKKNLRKQEKDNEQLKDMSDTKREEIEKKKHKLEFLVKAGGEERAQEEEDDEEDMALQMRRRKDKPKKQPGQEVDQDELSSTDSEEFKFNDNAFLKTEFKKMHKNQLDEEKDRIKRQLESYDI